MAIEGTNQHYVPQFLLRPFGAGRKKGRRIWRLDKIDGTSAHLPIKDVACGSGFYDLFGVKRSLDPLLAELETKTAPLFRRLLEDRRINLLSTPERRQIAFFIVVQMLRTPAQFEDFVRQALLTRSILSRMNATDELLSTFPTEASAVRNEYVAVIAGTAPTLTDYLMDKSWLLAECPTGTELYTSDNPVSRHNVIPAAPFRGNLGLSCEGIRLELPLSPTLCLQIACSKTVCRLALTDARFAYALGAGKPLPLIPQNVEFVNSLQVIHAERYVFSATGDFTMALSMLEQSPDLRKGPRSLVVHPYGDSFPKWEVDRAKEVYRVRRRAERRRHRQR